MRHAPRLTAAVVGVAVALPLAAMVPGSSAGAEQVAAASAAAAAFPGDNGLIAFVSPRDGSRDIYVMEPNGGGVRQLVAGSGGGASDPAWSPDGTRVAFSAGHELGGGVFAIDADGTDATQLTESPGGSELDSEPAWSPDGSRILFTRDRDGAPGSRQIWVMDANGDNEQLLIATPPADDDARVEGPAWSPDGRLIAYTRTGIAAESTELVVARSDGTSPRVIFRAADGGNVATPDWSPDGERIAFKVGEVEGEELNHDIYAVDADGENPVPLTDDPDPELDPVWSPDGGFILYSRNDPISGVWRMDADGRDQTRLSADESDSQPSWQSVPATPFDRPRVAFTDDDDALYQVQVSQTEAGESLVANGAPDSYAAELSGYQSGPSHEGEAGGVAGSPPAFVSTRQHPAGEVYLAESGDEESDVERITCDDVVETHPALSDGGMVAYAADSDPGAGEDWDIYVTSRVINLNRPPPGWSRPTHRRAETASALAPGSCPGWTTPVQVTAGAATDLWPTWTADDSLIFSRALEGELSDLYAVEQASGGWEEPLNLTSSLEAEESQPAAMAFQRLPFPPDCSSCDTVDQEWIAFTRVEYGGSGRIAFLSPANPGEVRYGPAGREPAWSSSVNPTHLAFTSTEEDPYGDIWVASLENPRAVSAERTDPPVIATESNLASGLGGIAESHPFWREPFDEGSARIVFTARSDVDIASEARILDADVSDVRATDGAQRRVLRRAVETDDSEVVHRYDEAGPSYSPDGTRIVYSRDAFGAGENFDARVLMVANADGTGPRALLPAAQRRSNDVDLDPVWSPDGTRIAFVRVRSATEVERGSVSVWIHDRNAGTTTQLDSPPGGADLSPNWSPDSEHLVVARSGPEGCCKRDGARRWGFPEVEGEPALYLLDPDTPSAPGVPITFCPDGCGFNLDGRSPAWSPDGSTIAFVYDGELLTIQLPDGWADGPGTPDEVEIDGLPDVVVGFENFGGEPTDSRTILSSAEDPAWSPDGTEIYFTGQPTGQPDQRGIWAIRPAGTGLRTVTDLRGPETEPAMVSTRTDVGVTVSVAGSPAVVGESVVATFTVTNGGLTPAFGVDLQTSYSPGATLAAVAPVSPGCTINGQGCDFAVLDPGETRTYRVQVTHNDPILGNAGATVTSTTFDPELSNNEDSEPYEFSRGDIGDLRVRVSVDDPVGYVGGLRTVTFGVRNLGPDPVDNVMLDVDWPAGIFPQPSLTLPFCLVVQVPCDLGTLGTVGPGDRQRFDVVVRLHSGGERLPIVARVTTTTADPNLANNRHRALLDVFQPELHILPAVAHPGQVVLAYGEQMPPGTEVEVDWARRTAAGLPLGDPILVNPSRSYLVDDDGSVRIPLLVLRRDLLGERVLTATSTTAEFLPLEAPMIVVLRQLGPPQFVGRG